MTDGGLEPCIRIARLVRKVGKYAVAVLPAGEFWTVVKRVFGRPHLEQIGIVLVIITSGETSGREKRDLVEAPFGIQLRGIVTETVGCPNTTGGTAAVGLAA